MRTGGGGVTVAARLSEFQGNERFEVVRRLGAGGMGVVYEAHHRQRDERVALKWLRGASAEAAPTWIAICPGDDPVQSTGDSIASGSRMKILLALLLGGAALVSIRRSARRNLGTYVGKIPSPLRFQLRQPATRAGCAVAGVVGALLAPLWFLRDQAYASPGPTAFVAMLGVLCGLVFGLLAVNVGFLIVRMFRAAPKLALEPGELVHFAAKSNQVFGGEVRHGALVLTTTRFAFCPGRFAVQLAPWFVRLSEVEQIECPGTALFVIRAPALAEPGLFLVPSSKAIVDRLRECGIGLELVSSENAASD
jgi:hypothetical protein